MEPHSLGVGDSFDEVAEEFERSGMIETQVFRRSLVYVGILGLVGLVVFIPACISSARAGNWIMVMVVSVGLALSVFLEGLAVNGVRTRRQRAKAMGGHKKPTSNSD